MKPLIDIGKKTIAYLESPKFSFLSVCLAFLGAVNLRNLLETYFNGEILSPTLLEDLGHYSISYVVLAMGLILIFYQATRLSVEKIARVVLPCFVILVFVPLIDLSLSFKGSFAIGYLFPEEHGNLGTLFVTFFGPLRSSGVTPGMRIEITVVLLSSYLYLFIKTNKKVKSLFFMFLIYVLIFFYCAVPFIYQGFLTAIRLPGALDIESLTFFFLVIGGLLGLRLLFLANKKIFWEIVRDSRPLRLGHYALMFVLGSMFSKRMYEIEGGLGAQDLFKGLFSLVAITGAWIFSVMTNNAADVAIDKITNKSRPTVTKAVSSDLYRKISLGVFAVTCLYALAVDKVSFLFALSFMVNYYLYSQPPLRLKRIPVLSKFIIALNSLICLILGIYIRSGQAGIPLFMAIFFAVFMTLAMNVIDLKDCEGDKGAGIRTLPVILGERLSQKVIGVVVAITYPLSALVFRSSVLLLPFAVFGIVEYYFINRNPYREKPVVVTYIISVVLLIVYFSFR